MDITKIHSIWTLHLFNIPLRETNSKGYNLGIFIFKKMLVKYMHLFLANVSDVF